MFRGVLVGVFFFFLGGGVLLGVSGASGVLGVLGDWGVRGVRGVWRVFLGFWGLFLYGLAGFGWLLGGLVFALRVACRAS